MKIKEMPSFATDYKYIIYSGEMEFIHATDDKNLAEKCAKLYNGKIWEVEKRLDN